MLRRIEIIHLQITLYNIAAIRKNSVFISELKLPVGENYRDVVTALTGRQSQ